MFTQLIGNDVLRVFWNGQTWPWTLPSMSNGDIDLWSLFFSLIIASRGLGCSPMCYESFGVVIFDLPPLLQGQMGSLTFDVDFSRLLLVLEVWDVHPTYRKSCAASLLEWLFLTSDPSFKVKWGHWPLKLVFSLIIASRGSGCSLNWYETMCWESFRVVRLHLWHRQAIYCAQISKNFISPKMVAILNLKIFG